MSTGVDQLEAHGSGVFAFRGHRTARRAGVAKAIKRETHRAERRIGKKLLDDAPKRRQFRGYEW